VLQSDETLESEMQRMLPKQGAALYTTRVPSAPDVTRETLAQMGPELTDAAKLLPPKDFAAVGYGCTSGTSVIGAEAVARKVQLGCASQAVTNPMSALISACKVMKVNSLAFLTPYIAEVSEGLRSKVAEAGIACATLGSFSEAEEAKVARISGASIQAAARDLAAGCDADAVFLSCTNLRTLDLIAPLEAELGLPVLSSNQVLAWHMLKLAGLRGRIPGRLGEL